MDARGLEILVLEPELETWLTTLRRAACVLAMNPDEVPPFVRARLRIALLEMAQRIDCELLRQAAWDRELEGLSLVTLPVEWEG